MLGIWKWVDEENDSLQLFARMLPEELEEWVRARNLWFSSVGSEGFLCWSSWLFGFLLVFPIINKRWFLWRASAFCVEATLREITSAAALWRALFFFFVKGFGVLNVD